MCEWKSELDEDYECREVAQPDSRFCIFHARTKDETRFRQRIHDRIMGGGESEASTLDFRGYVFPGDFILPTSCEENLILAESRVAGGVDISDTSIGGDAVFDGAFIEGDVLLNRTNFRGRASFARVIIRGGIEAWQATFGSGLSLFRTEVGGDVLLHEVRCEADLAAVRTRFKGDLDVVRSTVEGSMHLHLTGVVGDASFKSTKFRNLSLGGSRFAGALDLGGTSSDTLSLGSGKPTIAVWKRDRKGIRFLAPEAEQEFWRWAVAMFERSGQRDAADASHYYARSAMWKELLSSRVLVRYKDNLDYLANRGEPLRVEEWLEEYANEQLTKKLQLSRTAGWLRRVFYCIPWLLDFVFLRLATGYGSSLTRLFTTWFVVIAGFGCAYSVVPSLLVGDAASVWGLERWIIGFQFSVTTFTTLGLGDIYPQRLLGRFLTSLEAILGGVIMALTVLVIGRKFMR